MRARIVNTVVSPSPLTAGIGLTLLSLANLLSFADRALIGVVTEPIRHELHLSDTQIALLSGFSFSLFHLIAGIAIARWVDRGSRRLILALGVGLWSAATAATGVAQGFGTLMLSRMLVGVGEATVFPVAMSLLADFYPDARLPRAASIFQSSAGIGVMIGSVLAGLLAGIFGWRAMFVAFGSTGLVLVLLIGAGLGSTARPHEDDRQSERRAGLLAEIQAIRRVPGLGYLALGYASSTMMFACLPVWAPTFLQRSHGVPLSQVGAVVGPPAVIGGLAGTILSGILASRAIRKHGTPWAGLIVPIVALPLAVPAYALFLFASSLPEIISGIAVMNVMLSSSLGTCVALAVSLVPGSRRGLTSTLLLIVQTLIAFALGPLLIGATSDAITAAYGTEALRYAMSMMLATPLAGSLLLWFARRRMVSLTHADRSSAREA